MIDPDSQEVRQSGYDKLDRFLKIGEAIAGEGNSIVAPEARVHLIKNMSADNFLDILYSANGLLRGDKPDNGILIRQEDVTSVPKMEVKSALTTAPEIDPPEDGVELMKDWFERAKQDVTLETLDKFAIQTYSAIVFLHLFPDANGRTARNAFYYLSEGKLPDAANQERPYLISKFCELINLNTIKSLLEDEGLTKFKEYSGNDKLLGDYAEGESVKLRFLAIKKAGLLEKRLNGNHLEDIYAAYGSGEVKGVAENNQLFSHTGEPWTEEENIKYQEAYKQVRKDWFLKLMYLVGEDSDQTSQFLKDILEVPNPYALRLGDFAKLNQAVRDDNLNAALEIIHNVKYNRDADGNLHRFDDSNESVEQYLVKIMDKQRRKNLPEDSNE